MCTAAGSVWWLYGCCCYGCHCQGLWRCCYPAVLLIFLLLLLLLLLLLVLLDRCRD
jgi:hypothetical protein